MKEELNQKVSSVSPKASFQKFLSNVPPQSTVHLPCSVFCLDDYTGCVSSLPFPVEGDRLRFLPRVHFTHWIKDKIEAFLKDWGSLKNE